MTRPAMTMGRTGKKMVTQHGSFGKRALARKSSSDAIADDEVDSYAEIVYELYGGGEAGKVRSVQVPSGLLPEIHSIRSRFPKPKICIFKYFRARESCPCPSNPSDLGTRKPREHVHGETHEEVHREGQEERVQRAEDVAHERLDEMVLKEHNAMTIAPFTAGGSNGFKERQNNHR